MFFEKCRMRLASTQLIVHDSHLSKVYARLDTSDYEERKSEKRLSPMGKPPIEKRFSGAPLAAGWFLLFMALGIWIAWHAHERESVGLGIVAFFGVFGSYSWFVYTPITTKRAPLRKSNHTSSNLICCTPIALSAATKNAAGKPPRLILFDTDARVSRKPISERRAASSS
jgi:hypothetical protein